MILLECPETGERQLVRNAVGYAGWKLVSRNAPRPAEDNCNWCSEEQKWKADSSAQEKAARIAALKNEETLLDIIDRLESRIASLEAICGVEG